MSHEKTVTIEYFLEEELQKRHENFTNNFLLSYIEHEDDETKVALIEAAKLRKCLG
jgi:phosphoenolpyruvate carboxylase